MKKVFSFLIGIVFYISLFAWSGLSIEPMPVSYRFEPKPSRPLATYGTPSRDPKISVRASGALYLLAVSGNHGNSQLGLAISHDGGDSFAPPTLISRKGSRISSHGENSPTFSFGNGIEAYALWEERTGEGLGTELLFSKSPAFGHRWLPPIRVTDKATPSTNAFSSMTVSPRGHIYVVWLDGRDRDQGPPGTSSVYLAKSTDGGKSFEKNTAVVHGVCPCCRPTVLADRKGLVHVSWRHVYPGNVRDMAVATSQDAGKTFGSPVRVAFDNWKINGCPHAGASMVRRGNRLWISWYSDGDGSNPGVRVSYSDDSGHNFSDPILVSREILDANHPSFALADDGRILIAFQGRDPVAKGGWSPTSPYIVEISDSGQISQPILVPGHQKSVSYPVVVGGSLGRLAVAWSEKDTKGQPQIWLARGRRDAQK